MALGCTVVSTLIRPKLEGRTTPVSSPAWMVVEGVLEIGQTHHQPGGFGGPSERTIEAAKLVIEPVPLDQICQAKELVMLIQDLIETAAVEIARARQRRLGSHGKTPVLSGALPRCWHFTMLREDEESFSRNKLWVVQGRLLTPL
jgi:hypothetical protein